MLKNNLKSDSSDDLNFPENDELKKSETTYIGHSIESIESNMPNTQRIHFKKGQQFLSPKSIIKDRLCES